MPQKLSLIFEVTIFLDNSSVEGSEVSFGSRKNTPIKVCNGIHVILQDCLQQSLKTLHYDYKKVGPIFCLTCSLKDCSSHHEVNIGETSCYLHCSSTQNAKVSLPKYHLYHSPDITLCLICRCIYYLFLGDRETYSSFEMESSPSNLS